MIQPIGPSTAAQMMPDVMRPLLQPINAPTPMQTRVKPIAHAHKAGSSSMFKHTSFMRISASTSDASIRDRPLMLHSSVVTASASGELDRRFNATQRLISTGEENRVVDRW